MPDSEWVLYGANGYTGRCIAEEAVRRSLRPLVAGRSAQAIARLAAEFGLDHRVFSLHDAAPLRASIRGAKLILNCAGPFSATARPLMEACLAEGVHYLDITGEIDVIEAAAALDDKAKAAGVVLMPAVGFDVVPSDCLATTLSERLPDASRLQLAISTTGSISRGTAKTMLEVMSQGGRARIDGRIERVPLAWKSREIPFREGPRTAMTIPWGDVASAYYSTGIGNIEVYVASPARQIAALRRWGGLISVLAAKPVLALAKRIVERRVPGPSAASRERETASLWGRVENPRGQHVEGTLTTPNGYALTVMTALAAVERLLNSEPRGGFLTPALAFGSGFITTIPGCDLRCD
ncbi:MAG TPA: saccharopine dehydrogenase NADP-binding domain-containing protein [Planctomycetaceae bacterium]|jgi:short subunit dehydrogenase-like uncharacterized protein|nr:saccharopine dehydrogenase NADP-binding domain-containing protein [Planctomycetaceae bacterium]